MTGKLPSQIYGAPTVVDSLREKAGWILEKDRQMAERNGVVPLGVDMIKPDAPSMVRQEERTAPPGSEYEPYTPQEAEHVQEYGPTAPGQNVQPRALSKKGVQQSGSKAEAVGQRAVRLKTARALEQGRGTPTPEVRMQTVSVQGPPAPARPEEWQHTEEVPAGTVVAPKAYDPGATMATVPSANNEYKDYVTPQGAPLYPKQQGYQPPPTGYKGSSESDSMTTMERANKARDAYRARKDSK